MSSTSLVDGSAVHRLRSVLINASLVVLSLLITLAGLELALRVMGESEGYSRPLRDVDYADVTRFQPHRTARYRSSEFDFTIGTNRFGRRDREWSAATMADPRNILTVGDSFVLGYGVLEEASIPSRMEALAVQRGTPLEVFNFGMGGEIALPEYLRLFDRAMELGIGAERVVVAIFLGNDFNRRPAERAHVRGDGSALSPSSAWWSRAVAGSRLYSFVRGRIAASPPAVDLLLRLGEALDLPVFQAPSAHLFRRRYTSAQQLRFDWQLQFMDRLWQSAQHRRRKLLFVLIPNKIQVENPQALDNTHFDPDRPNRLILDHCRERQLRCVDLTDTLRDAYRESGDPLYFPVDRHFTERGYWLAARRILAELERSP